MDTKTLDLEPTQGGTRLVTLAKVTGHRSYQAKDGTTRFVTTIIYGGGNRDLFTPPEHPIYQLPEGKPFLMYETFLENRFGWSPQGEPKLLELSTK